MRFYKTIQSENVRCADFYTISGVCNLRAVGQMWPEN